MKISQRRGSPKACCAIATEVGVVLAFFVQQKLKEISQACLNKMAYRDRLLLEYLPDVEVCMLVCSRQ